MLRKQVKTLCSPVYNVKDCFDAMQAMLSEEEFIGFLRGNSFKYRWRMRDKRQAVQDLRKAQWYEKRLKDIFEKMSTPNAV